MPVHVPIGPPNPPVHLNVGPNPPLQFVVDLPGNPPPFLNAGPNDLLFVTPHLLLFRESPPPQNGWRGIDQLLMDICAFFRGYQEEGMVEHFALGYASLALAPVIAKGFRSLLGSWRNHRRLDTVRREPATTQHVNPNARPYIRPIDIPRVNLVQRAGYKSCGHFRVYPNVVRAVMTSQATANGFTSLIPTSTAENDTIHKQVNRLIQQVIGQNINVSFPILISTCVLCVNILELAATYYVLAHGPRSAPLSFSLGGTSRTVPSGAPSAGSSQPTR